MIDTIVLRIRNLTQYKLLHDQFYATNEKKNTIIEGYSLVSQDGEVQEATREWQRVTAYQDSGKFLPFVTRFDIRSPSSVYYVRGVIRNMGTDKAFLEVEFSMPKYFYGTNVFQMVSIPPKDSEMNYLVLIKAIRRFIRDNFNQLPKDKDIQIFRLDMCYNQFFNSKEQALKYLDFQRDHMKKVVADKSMRLVDTHDTTWTVLTQKYSFKCYHKGTEFAKNDATELSKSITDGRIHKNTIGQIQKPKYQHNYNIGKLQSIADCILRYEITYRSPMLHYLYTYYAFQDPAQQKTYLLGNNMYSYLKRVEKRGGFAQQAYQLGVKQKHTSPIEYFMSKQKAFCLKSVFDKPYDFTCVFSDTVTFNLPVYKLLYNFFWNKVKVSQVNEAMPVAKMLQTFQEYKERFKARKKAGLTLRGKNTAKSLAKGNLKQAGNKNTARLAWPIIASQFIDIRESKRFLPIATYKRLIADWKAMGLPFKQTLTNVKPPPLDYADNTALLEPIKINAFL